MTERILRWGLLSTARINRALIPPLRKSKRNRLVAVASRDRARAEEYAREWKISRVFDSYEALLADPEIDVIYNPLPNSLHVEWTLKAVQAGKHVLCEKPLALTPQDVDRVAEAAQQAGVVVAEAFMYRHHAQTLKVKELVDAGAIGQLRFIRGSFTYPINGEGNVRLAPELGGGSIWDVGCYPINYARYLAGGEPLEVFGWQVLSDQGIDMTFTGQMRFANDVFAQFDSSFSFAFRTQMEVVGSEGSLYVPVPFKPLPRSVIHLTQGDKEQTIRIQSQALYLGEVEDMADAILLGKPPRISLADSRGNVAAILAFLKSARQGRPVA